MTPIAPSGTPIVVGRFKKPAEAVFTGGPEHAISYTWQLASNVAIIYPDSRLYGNLDQGTSRYAEIIWVVVREK